MLQLLFYVLFKAHVTLALSGGSFLPARFSFNKDQVMAKVSVTQNGRYLKTCHNSSRQILESKT